MDSSKEESWEFAHQDRTVPQHFPLHARTTSYRTNPYPVLVIIGGELCPRTRKILRRTLPEFCGKMNRAGSNGSLEAGLR